MRPSTACDTPPAPRVEDWSQRPGAIARQWPSEQMIRLLCRALGDSDRSALTVAEVGCGNGRNALALSRMGFGRVIASDPSAELVEATRGLLCGAPCETDAQCAALPALPLESAGTDIVICWGVLFVVGGVESAQAAMHELARILRPGGLLITDWRGDGDSLLNFAETRVDQRTIEFSSRAPINLAGARYSFWDESGVRRIHADSGFELTLLQRESIDHVIANQHYEWWQACATLSTH